MPNEGNIRLSDGVVELPDGRRFSPGQPEWLATIERNYDADLVLAGIEGDDVPDVVQRALAGEPVEPVERVADVADDAPRAPSPAPERAPAPDPLPGPDAPRASMPEKPMDRATRTALDRYRAAVNPEHYGDVTPTGAQGLFPKPGAFGPTTVEEATPRRRTARVAGIGAIGGLGLGTALGFYLDQRRNKSREDAPVEMAAFRLNMAAPEIEARYQVEAEKLFDDMLGRPREMIQSEVDDLNVILGTTTLSDVQRAEYERQRIERFRELKAARRKWSRIPSKVSDEDAILYHWELAQEQARENVDAQVAGELRDAQARSQPQEQPRSVRQRRPDPPVPPAPVVEAPASVQAPDPVSDPVPESSPDTSTRRFRGWKGTAVSTVGGLGLGVIMGKMLTNRNQGEQMADARYDMAPIDPIPQGTYKPSSSPPVPSPRAQGPSPEFTREQVEAVQRQWLEEAAQKSSGGDVLARARAIGERAGREQEKAIVDELKRVVPTTEPRMSYNPMLTSPQWAALTPFLKTYGEDRDSLEQLAREYGMEDDAINRSRAAQLATPRARAESVSRPRLNPQRIDRLARDMADEGPAARFDPDTLAAMWARHGDYVEGSDIPERWVPLELSERGETAIEGRTDNEKGQPARAVGTQRRVER